MKLVSFHITNFRSVIDSGEIAADRITAILGRNESGKSNLLRALASLNPPGGIQALTKIKDFPRHRRLSDCTDNTPVVDTMWELDSAERAELAANYPRAAGVSHVQIARPYGPTHSVKFMDLPPETQAGDVVAQLVREARAYLAVGTGDLGGDHTADVVAAVEIWANATLLTDDSIEWPARALEACAALRQAFAAAGSSLPHLAATPVAEIEKTAAQLQAEPVAAHAGRVWVLERLPVFVFLDDFPDLHGHQNIKEYIARKDASTRSAADINFEKLCKVAGLNPDELYSLGLAGEHEFRNQLVNRASAVVTGEVRRLWSDRQLKIRFNLDAEHLDTLISDPSDSYDVEVNLDDRSRGFRWFFSFYVVFAADTQGGSADGAILLLDEPGLFLHAMSQADLLQHFDNDFKNQIVYTTHSPFMVPTHAIERVRTANIAHAIGTTVSNDPSGDARTLFPLQSALGYSISQSLFLGGHNLVVEGVTDYWIISSAAAFIADQGLSPRLDKRFTITPAGGASKVGYMVTLLASERLKVVVLLDDEAQGRQTRADLLKSKLIRGDGVAFVSEAFDEKPSEADIEDLLDPDVFDALVQESYGKELQGRSLTLNQNIPRIARRYEAALAELGIEFFKTRPARLLLDKIGGATPEAFLTPATIDRFQRLFGSLNGRLAQAMEKAGEPFG